MEKTLAEIAESLEKGRCRRVKDLVKMALKEGCPQGKILEQGLLKGMENVGQRFRTEMVEIPEILSITRALKGGMEVLSELSDREKAERTGTVLVGTMRGDMHDIGKNLVRIMLESKGFKVIDLGVNVSPRRFVDAAISERADVVCCSGFLKESVADMRRMVAEFENKGIRESIYIMVGGVAVDEAVAKKIGADCYTKDAAGCSEMALSYCRRLKRRR